MPNEIIDEPSVFRDPPPARPYAFVDPATHGPFPRTPPNRAGRQGTVSTTLHANDGLASPMSVDTPSQTRSARGDHDERRTDPPTAGSIPPTPTRSRGIVRSPITLEARTPGPFSESWWDIVQPDEAEPEAGSRFVYTVLPENSQITTRVFPRGLNPLKPPPEDGVSNLWELLIALRLNAVSPFYLTKDVDGKDVLNGTKNLSLKAIPSSLELRFIKHEENMFQAVRREVKETLASIVLDWSSIPHRNFLSLILPYFTSSSFPGLVHSERDLDRGIANVIIDPIMWLVEAASRQAIPTRLQAKRDSYCSSAVQDPTPGAVVPDLILVRGPAKYPNEDIVIRVEAKASNVIYYKNVSYLPQARQGPAGPVADDEDDLDQDEVAWGVPPPSDEPYSEPEDDEHHPVTRLAHADRRRRTQPATSSQGDRPPPAETPADFSHHILESIVAATGGARHAARFVWPTAKRVARLKKQGKARIISRQTKVIVQVWEQLLKDELYEPAFNILSSLETTTFIVRLEDTMYISQNYRYDDSNLMLDMFCFFWCALGYSDSLHISPVEKTRMTPEALRAAEDCVGLVEESLSPEAWI